MSEYHCQVKYGRLQGLVSCIHLGRREVLVMVMRKHQRYFPVYSQGGQELLPYFITVANGLIHPQIVIAGI